MSADLERRLADSLEQRGLPPTPPYRRLGASTPPEEVLDARIFAAIEEARALNRPRTVLPASLEGLWLLRIGFLRRAALKLLAHLFEDERRLNAALIRVAELQAERAALHAQRKRDG